MYPILIYMYIYICVYVLLRERERYICIDVMCMYIYIRNIFYRCNRCTCISTLPIVVCCVSFLVPVIVVSGVSFCLPNDFVAEFTMCHWRSMADFELPKLHLRPWPEFYEDVSFSPTNFYVSLCGIVDDICLRSPIPLPFSIGLRLSRSPKNWLFAPSHRTVQDTFGKIAMENHHL